jgi:hypothetical protein
MVPLYEQYGFYHRALQTVLGGMKEYTGNLLQRDGILQRFEYTIELLRKTIKRILEFQNVVFSPTPNDSLRE